MVEKFKPEPPGKKSKNQGEAFISPETHHRLLALIFNLTRQGEILIKNNFEYRRKVLPISEEVEIILSRVRQKSTSAISSSTAAMIEVRKNADKFKKGEMPRSTVYFVLKTQGRIFKGHAMPLEEFSLETIEHSPRAPEQEIQELITLLETFQESADQTHLEE